jgi:hypothetical protein
VSRENRREEVKREGQLKGGATRREQSQATAAEEKRRGEGSW